MIKGTDYGLGTDIWNVSKAEYERFTKVSSRTEDNSMRMPAEI